MSSRGPGVGSAIAVGEAADGVAQLFVAGSAEAGAEYFARLAGGGSHVGPASQCSTGSHSDVADFGQMSYNSASLEPRVTGEDVRVGLNGEFAELLGEHMAMLHDGAGGNQQRRQAKWAATPWCVRCTGDPSGITDAKIAKMVPQ